MPYVERDEGGNIVGIYANKQEGIAEEFIPEESQEIVDFRSVNVVKYPVHVNHVEAIDLWSRLTNEEGEAVGEAMDSQPFRIRKIFETAKTFREDHELWPLLESMAVSLFGEDRAREILAPSNHATVDPETV